MSDIIHLLPDSVANQIAAGEVIQRPSSVIKELVENAIDAGATSIQIIIKDAGRTLIQVIDNGKGMSETDARMSFERHATSKITSAADLFRLHTMGFRGEALASIAAIAHVELRTRRASDELGTCIQIKASVVEKQEEIACAVGSNFMIKNLFFNVPARRKFLKTNETEFRHILTIFQQIALVYPAIAFSLTHNETEVFQLSASNYRVRIGAIFGSKINPQLLPIEVNTQLISFFGFIGNPSFAQKRTSNQYFFVNGRYIQHPYFYKAIALAYEKLLPTDTKPSFFIYLQVDPSAIDVNIHPTKTEVKFEHEQAIFPILSAAVKETLGKTNVVPSIDFDQENAPEIPVAPHQTYVAPPTIKVDPSYSPFTATGYSATPVPKTIGWETLYKEFDAKKNPSSHSPCESLYKEVVETEQLALYPSSETDTSVIQLRKQYILFPTEKGITIIHQQRAHIQHLYAQYVQNMQQKRGISQQLLFPEIIELTPSEHSCLLEILEDISYIGFRLEEFGKHTYQVVGVPTQIDSALCVDVLHTLIESVQQASTNIKKETQERIALTLAKKAAIKTSTTLSHEEMNEIVQSIQHENAQQFTADGKRIVTTISLAEIDKIFN
jgi:DNA mismatch repair protein MutL